MNYRRIDHAIDIESLSTKCVMQIGVGASVDYLRQLLRCGTRRFKLFDPDRVGPENLCRQGYEAADISRPKVEAAADSLRRIDPDVSVETFFRDCTQLADDELESIMSNVDLLVLATDSFKAQAFGNQIALRFGTPVVFIGVYEAGAGGEVIFWHRELLACMRCLCPSRFRAREVVPVVGESLDPPSDGTTILDVGITDSIAATVCLSLMTRGHGSRFGRMIDALGDRNFLQIKLDPDWLVNGRDIVREQLGVLPNCDTFFAWNTIARRDPDAGQLPCPDCERFRGHRFVEVDGKWKRIIPEKVG